MGLNKGLFLDVRKELKKFELDKVLAQIAGRDALIGLSDLTSEEYENLKDRKAERQIQVREGVEKGLYSQELLDKLASEYETEYDMFLAGARQKIIASGQFREKVKKDIDYRVKKIKLCLDVVDGITAVRGFGEKQELWGSSVEGYSECQGLIMRWVYDLQEMVTENHRESAEVLKTLLPNTRHLEGMLGYGEKEEIPFFAPLYEYTGSLAVAMESVLKKWLWVFSGYFYDAYNFDEEYEERFKRTADSLRKPEWRKYRLKHYEISDFTKEREKEKAKFVSELMKLFEKTKMSKAEIMSHKLVKQSAVYEALMMPVPFRVAFSSRFEHCHIVASTGHGKSQLLMNLIYNDLARAKEGKCGLCVIDSQGDLIDVISHLSLFDPDFRGNLSDKLVIIDANDVEFPVSLNIFDVKAERFDKLSTKDREKAYNSAISLYDYVFSDLVGGELTDYQKNIFQYCAQLLLAVPGSTLLDLISLMEGKFDIEAHLGSVSETVREFFKNQFNSSVYAPTKRQVAVRLWAVIRNNTFKNMFVNEVNKVDMFEAMNNGKVVLINTSKELLQSQGAKMLGKFFVALMFQSVLLRASIAEDERKPFFCYIDEAQDYMTEMLGEFFTQARKYKVGLILAHQFLGQLDNVSKHLKESVLTNCSVKFVGRVEPPDARVMANSMRVNTDEILDLRKEDWKWTEFYCFVKDIMREGARVRVPFGVVYGKEKISDEGFEALVEANREKYCVAKGKEEILPPLKEGTGEEKEGGFRVEDLREL